MVTLLRGLYSANITIMKEGITKMDENDRKTLARIRWEQKLSAPQIRAETFKSPKEFKRKPKHKPDYTEEEYLDY